MHVLEKMRQGRYSGSMSQTAFFSQHALPVLTHLSAETRRQLESYMQEGNTAFRQKRLLEFFKTVDWVSEDEIREDRFLQKLPPALRRQLIRELADYHADRANTRVENAQKRDEYKQRIYEYFRHKMPSADKALLESLRDYELNLTGRDVNWRHYFTLDSFRKIDAFIQASPAERQALFAKFKQDVDTYKKNYDKIHHAQQCQDHGFTFDDWCDMMGDEAPRARQSKQQYQQKPSSGANSAVLKAYQTLRLEFNATPDAAKRQFRKLTLEHHPDLPSGNEEAMKAIVNAYHELQRYWETAAQVR